MLPKCYPDIVPYIPGVCLIEKKCKYLFPCDSLLMRRWQLLAYVSNRSELLPQATRRVDFSKHIYSRRQTNKQLPKETWNEVWPNLYNVLKGQIESMKQEGNSDHLGQGTGMLVTRKDFYRVAMVMKSCLGTGYTNLIIWGKFMSSFMICFFLTFCVSFLSTKSHLGKV